ncbi:MAG TPA: hypothetical protein VK611_26160 [Acidimicrobiales bacterium]|nr:hypothetical protein [Acidimicrobiales bacterium]
MTPQTYPLWAVEKGSAQLSVVIGWESRETGMVPVVVAVGRGLGAQPRVAPPGVTLYDDREEAVQVTNQNMRRQVRSV